MRASLTFRLTFIFLSLCLAFWTVLVVYYYLRNDLSTGEVNPSPAKLVHIVEALSATPQDEREPLLEMIRSATLRLEIVGEDTVAGTHRNFELRNHQIGAPYLDVLGDRLLHVETTFPGFFNGGMKGIQPRHSPLGLPQRALTFWLKLDDGSVLIVRSTLSLVVTPFGLPAGLGAGLVGTVFAFLAFLLFHREISPIRKLAAAVEEIDPAGERVELPRFRAATPEVRTLTEAFDRLQVRLQSLTRSRMSLIGGIQHDVRSFATRLRLRVEALPDIEERARSIADINDMIGLLDNALLTTKAGFGALDQQLLDLSEWLPLEISDLKSVGLDVSFAGSGAPPGTEILGDRVALRRILTNLIDNAVKYGKAARVTLLQEDTAARIVIDDEGEGFGTAKTDLLLEPFVRADPSRARNTGGAGLGLAVARTLVEAHGGNISLSNRPGGGGRAVVALPLYPA